MVNERGIKMFARNTYLEINLKNLSKNVKTLIKIHPDYKYYFGVVKADCYGQGSGTRTVRTLLQSGCNYLAVATLEEGLEIRKKFDDVPILCLGVVSSQYIETCLQNNITVTIPNLAYLEEILEELEPEDCEQLKVHLKINTGMNRLGMKNHKEIRKVIQTIQKNHMILEGIYTHIYDAENEKRYQKQIDMFQELLQGIDLSKTPIVHIAASEALMNYEKPDFVNGCRLGIIMYGFTTEKVLGLKNTAKLMSEVIQIHDLEPGETVGYGGVFEAKENTRIAVIPIGYADGIIRRNTGRNVYIHDEPYPIVGNICMDMLFVKVDDMVDVHDEVYLLRDNEHIEEVAEYLETIPYEVLCSIGKRVPRVYK